jgi:hypothetical protein
MTKLNAICASVTSKRDAPKFPYAIAEQLPVEVEPTIASVCCRVTPERRSVGNAFAIEPVPAVVLAGVGCTCHRRVRRVERRGCPRRCLRRSSGGCRSPECRVVALAGGRSTCSDGEHRYQVEQSEYEAGCLEGLGNRQPSLVSHSLEQRPWRQRPCMGQGHADTRRLDDRRDPVACR